MGEVKPLLQTIIEFNRLNKTEVGGIRGHVLGPRFTRLLDEFHNVEGKLNSMKANILQIPDAQFTAILKEVQGLFLDLDVWAVAIAVWAITLRLRTTVESVSSISGPISLFHSV
jgi:hypothetical protein